MTVPGCNPSMNQNCNHSRQDGASETCRGRRLTVRHQSQEAVTSATLVNPITVYDHGSHDFGDGH